MQTIMGTFRAYHQAGTSGNIFDPVANAAAAINYIKSRYGSINNVPGIRSMAHGGPYVGYSQGTWDTGPYSQLALLHPHETVLPNGALTAGGRGGGTTVVIDVHDNTVMSNSDIDRLVDKIGKRVATQLLPAGGTRIRM
jgi:SLT domain-containing protein